MQYAILEAKPKQVRIRLETAGKDEVCYMDLQRMLDTPPKFALKMAKRVVGTFQKRFNDAELIDYLGTEAGRAEFEKKINNLVYKELGI